MRLHFLYIMLLALAFQSRPALSQILRGRITGRSGDAIQYATVYIQELKQGTVSDGRGDYEIRLPEGNYTVIFQSLGYEPLIINIDLEAGTTLTRDLELPEQFYEIPEVSISASGEDPAYAIMRKVIGLAPYHLNQVNHYKANVYLKGNLVINKIPRIIQKSMQTSRSGDAVSISAGGKPEENSVKIREGDSYVMESVNEIEFTAPDKYVQKVISFHSTFPDGGTEVSPMDYIQASFYQPVLVDMAISPLSPQAFSHYRFRYAGASPQGEYIVDKIEVIPRRKSQQLFSGTIYIIEDLWCLHSVDLTNENIAGKIMIRGLYIPVREETWMPVSYKIEFSFSMFGIRADAGYGTSVKYLEVEQNDNLQKPQEYVSSSQPGFNAPDTSVTANRQKIESLLRKEDLTNRDMVRLANLMKKESEGSVADSVRKSLEIREKTTYIIEKDAWKKDSAYWAEIRPIPLSEPEVRSLRVNDSIRNASQSIKETGSDTSMVDKTEQKSLFLRSLGRIVSGHTWYAGGASLRYGGLIDPKNFSFNTVDGFFYGNDFRITRSFENGSAISLYPSIRYAFSREKLMWRANASFTAGGMKEKQLYFRTGMISTDISSGTSVNPFINTATSLLMKRNYLKLYESFNVTAGYKTELTNGLTAEISAGYDNRRVLENSTHFSLVKLSREYSDNTPVSEYLDPEAYPSFALRDHKHFNFVTNVTFTPFQKYSINNGRKINRGSEWPTFRVIWKHGINEYPGDGEESGHFDMFTFEASGKKQTGAFSEFRWKARTGGFAGRRNISYFDFFHFNAQPLVLLLSDYEDAFMLPRYYSLSTPEFFGEFHMRYTTPYLLLKFLPGLSNTLIRENLSFSYLGSRNHKHYTEAGYTLSELFLIGEAGVFIGFDNLNYRSIGAKIVLRIN